MSYEEFLLRKKHSSIDMGIEPILMNDMLFDFQNHIADYAIRKGRCACFVDTGLGKTLIELIVAQNYVLSTNKRVLIITPLAVAFQFITEANKFGIDDVSYSRYGKLTSKIVICNYERLHLFNPNDYDCVILDESSILKNYDGKIKEQITDFIKKTKYRFLFTATPSPNDFIELGTSSEALGELGYVDMLTKFFVNNEDTIKPQNIGTKWRLKGHAEEAFFDWVRSWSISVRKPSDIGYSDERHILPELITNFIPVKNNDTLVINGQTSLFPIIARTQSEVRQEQKITTEQRCEKAVEVANNHDTSVYWCNLNYEGDLLTKLDKNAYQIKGSMSIEQKEEILLAFANGDIKKLVTKAQMTAFGLNWQHCNHTIYFPTFSYEQYYQAIRRFYRFGQKNNVICDMVHSEGQQRVLDSLIAKSHKADTLYTQLTKSSNQLKINKKETIKRNINLPKFI